MTRCTNNNLAIQQNFAFYLHVSTIAPSWLCQFYDYCPLEYIQNEYNPRVHMRDTRPLMLTAHLGWVSP
jgi:hypothetical protein